MSNTYDFDVRITCRHDECTEAFKAIVIEEVQKLSKYHTRIINGDIICDRQNSNIQVEISLHIPGTVINASESDFAIEKAFDASMEKIKVQLKKIHSKETDHRAPSQPEFGDAAESTEL